MEIGKISPDGTVEKDFYVQGWIYKNYDNFEKKKGVCYVPELSDEKYTYDDFLKICKNDKTLARLVFELVDWQHPETLADELEETFYYSDEN